MPNPDKTTPNPQVDDGGTDIQERVLYSALSPAVSLAFLFGYPVAKLSDLIQMAYFHHARQRGLKMREVAEHLGVSARKAAQLSTRLKKNFMKAEQERELPRRIEFMLWATPLSKARLKQVLPDVDVGHIEQAMAQLVEEGRIRLLPGRANLYEVVGSQFRLVSSDWLARIDGLNNLMASATNAIYGRFFKKEPNTFARTVSLRIREEDLPSLEALYRDAIWPKLVEFDEAAKDDMTAREMDISVLWAPYEYTTKLKPNDKEKT